MRKSTTYTMRVLPSDLERWRLSAQRNGLTLPEYIRRRVNERPLKATKPYYAEEQAAERKALLEESERQRIAKLQAGAKRGP